MEKLLAFLNSLAPDARKIFCDACNTTEGYLRKACSKGEPLGVELCMKIEKESNRYLVVEELRPSVDLTFIRATGCDCKCARE